MITPTLNINGSSAGDLIEPRIEAMGYLNNAMHALHNALPNGRDYSDSEKCTADRKKHYDRIEAINDICNAIMKEALAIKRQSKGVA